MHGGANLPRDRAPLLSYFLLITPGPQQQPVPLSRSIYLHFLNRPLALSVASSLARAVPDGAAAAAAPFPERFSASASAEGRRRERVEAQDGDR